MTLKIFNFLLVILLFKFAYSANFNYLLANMSTCKKDSKGINETIYHSEGESFFKGDNYNQMTNYGIDFVNCTNNTDPTFYLYTRDYHNGKVPEVLDQFNVSSLDNSHLKQKPIYVLVHGFGGNGSLEWIISLKDALLQKEDCNVLSFDWPAGHIMEDIYKTIWSYGCATKRIPSVGNKTAIFIESIIELGNLSLDSVHCIGHSLGAHVCGFTGKTLNGRMGRISGLDPARPLYHDCDASGRLDKSDALYVDVIHTDACGLIYCYGLDQDIGHSNFYPNGGVNQPGCPNFQYDKYGCSHSMSYKYFIASLDFNTSSTYFLARPCQNYNQYLNLNCSCGEKLQFMGFYAKPELRGSFYLKTLGKPPYALEDKGCVVVKSSNFIIKSSNFIITNFAILEFVVIIMMIVILITYIIWRRFCCSPSSNEEESLLGKKKASGRTGVV